jgi:hypothetical protein
LLLRVHLRSDIAAAFEARSIKAAALALLHYHRRLVDDLRSLRAVEPTAVRAGGMALTARRLRRLTSAVVLLLVVAPVAVTVLVLLLGKRRCRRCAGEQYAN